MIFGKTKRVSDQDKEWKRTMIAARNSDLQDWHKFFTFFPVALLDGRTAILTWVSRKFFVDADLSGYACDIREGSTDILDIPQHKLRDFGFFEYRVRGSLDVGSVKGNEPSTAEKIVPRRVHPHERKVPGNVSNGRRQAIIKQKARGEK